MNAQKNPHCERYLAVIESQAARLAENFERLDIYSGNLFYYVDKDLKAQLNEGAYKQAKHRIAPINALTKIIQKLSQIYSGGVSRQIVGSTAEADSSLFGWYQETMKPSQKMQLGNSYFNLFGNALVFPVLDYHSGNPRLRIIPSDRFVPYNFGGAGEDEAEGVVIYIKTGRSIDGKRDVKFFQQVNATWYSYFDSEGINRTGEFAGPTFVPNAFGFADHGIGRRPFTYINRDPNRLLPTMDTDLLKMTKLIPILLTDINFAHMFQAFAIVYGINIVDKGLTFAPNAVWTFETAPGGGAEKRPEIGTIKPDADISGGLELIANQFAMWLNTRGIKPGAIGEINGSNFASGISKIMDEMDTSENRTSQVPFFEDGEADMWDLILKYQHPIWRKDPTFKGPRAVEFSPKASVACMFSEQVPLVRRGAVVDEAKKEVEAGYSTTRRALKRINPSYTEAEITGLIAEVDAERKANSAAAEALNGAQVTSLVDVLVKVGLGVLPQATAMAVMQTAFGLTEDAAKALAASIPPGSVKPEQVA